ncbi:hypothetical protein EVAR_82923_1 [Eumeta japonica]|uniref:Uncharacterized protein n=1 Tax=Eumeta variegata TaxID=151549 RepID=A0A4C1X0L3_EUMVA|nr:hypothetical protein EVAR_82923_1 [Eumeta japonica]
MYNFLRELYVRHSQVASSAHPRAPTAAGGGGAAVSVAQRRLVPRRTSISNNTPIHNKLHVSGHRKLRDQWRAPPPRAPPARPPRSDLLDPRGASRTVPVRRAALARAEARSATDDKCRPTVPELIAVLIV